MDQAAVGFRVKSGWAAVVLLAGPAAEPKVLDRTAVRLADPEVAGSVHPFHAGLELPENEGPGEVARLVGIVEQFAGRSIGDLVTGYRRTGRRLVGAGIVVGSQADPVTIRNDHIRAHAEEGRLFRVVIEDAARRLGLPSSVTVEKQLLARASEVLGRPAARLKEDVRALGKTLGGRWRGEEKSATLAAWMLL